MFVACRRAFLIRLDDEPKQHPWIVITEPAGTPPEVVIVPLRSRKKHSDTTVVLEVGDHPFIQHPTVVHYSDARIVRVTRLQAQFVSGGAASEHDVSEQLLARIREGLFHSPHTVNAVRVYCERILQPHDPSEE